MTNKPQLQSFDHDSFPLQGTLITLTGGGDYPQIWISFSAPDLDSAMREDILTLSEGGDEYNIHDTDSNDPILRELLIEGRELSYERTF